MAGEDSGRGGFFALCKPPGISSARALSAYGRYSGRGELVFLEHSIPLLQAFFLLPRERLRS